MIGQFVYEYVLCSYARIRLNDPQSVSDYTHWKLGLHTIWPIRTKNLRSFWFDDPIAQLENRDRIFVSCYIQNVCDRSLVFLIF